MNLVTAVQKAYGFNAFDKINPNRQDKTVHAGRQHYTQVATITVLTGLYNYGSTENGAKELFRLNADQLLNRFFQPKEKEIINVVSKYGNEPVDDTNILMKEIAVSATGIVKKYLGPSASDSHIMSFIAGQRHHILVFLPQDLGLGDLLNNNLLEDRTNKMEGPVSGGNA